MITDASCERARLALWPDPETGPAPPDARAHYADCPSCRRFFVIQRRLGRRMAAVDRPAAPERLHRRVRAGLAQADAPTWRSRPALAGAALAGLAAVAAVALVLGLARRPPALIRPLAAVLASADLTIRVGDPAAIEAWLRRELGREVQVPAIADARVRGARLVDVEGRRAAAVAYEMHGLPLVWFALGNAELSGRPILPEMEIRAFRAAGYEIALWGEPEGARAVAARMPRDAVVAIAAECRRKALMRPGFTWPRGTRSRAPYHGTPAG